MISWLSAIPDAYSKPLVVLLGIAAVASVDMALRLKHKSSHVVFAVILGTVLAMGALKATQMVFGDGPALLGPYAATIMVVLLIAGWRLLFGPWDPLTKAVVLGVFLFWISFHIIYTEAPADRVTHLIAIAVALVPAAVWCGVFLPYHMEHRSSVALMFFAGMLATVPVLFYDALVRKGVELQFFYFRIVPQSFNAQTQSFVSGQLPAGSAVHKTIAILLLSFILVALIEEGCKLWVLRKSGEKFFSSIDEAVEFSILVAIGFAFAENVTHSGYFLHFVRQYVMEPPTPDWLGFFGNVAGRSVLTSMVHIVSTGIMGYFLGKAFFASQCLEEDEKHGIGQPLVDTISNVLGLPASSVYRIQMITLGLTFAVALHATSNFLVTLPDALPGNPRTFGALFHMREGNLLHTISIVALPCLLYVVGGFWLLSWLLERRENRVERGQLKMVEEFVEAPVAV